MWAPLVLLGLLGGLVVYERIFDPTGNVIGQGGR